MQYARTSKSNTGRSFLRIAISNIKLLGLVSMTFSSTVVACFLATKPGIGEEPTSQSGIQVIITQQDLEQDYLRQVELREWSAATRRAATTADDARGACDGIKDGKWGFHTERELRPWWQVDLGSQYCVESIVVYNRCDTVASRAARLQVLISSDARQWTQVYQHDGTVFYGFTDGRPLRIILNKSPARFVRVQLPDTEYLHLDEVEVYAEEGGQVRNVALYKAADQSSLSMWSRWHPEGVPQARCYPVRKAVERGLALAEELLQLASVGPEGRRMIAQQTEKLRQIAVQARSPDAADQSVSRELYLQACLASRRIALLNPLLNFESLVFVKRKPPVFHHMSDQHYGWWCRPDGGLYILEGWKTDSPRLRCLTARLPSGSVIRPDVSYDGKRILFSYARYYPELHTHPNKLDKNNVPEDAFYHVYEVNSDGTGLRRLTYGKFDDIDARYLPDGRIVFLSTRRGVATQVLPGGRTAAINSPQPDCYVRCGGGPERPVAVYTLHVMNGDGTDIRPISAFESFEWHPCVDFSGRILYARWDYVDRHNQPFMGLWSTLPDGTGVQAVYGNFTWNPLSVFEARPVPGSHKIVFTASAHHSITGGSLVLLDPRQGTDDEAPLTRLTPEVCFPESEGWPAHYYANPYPLSERFFLVSWSDKPLADHGGQMDDAGPGLYLYDAFGNLHLIYRDPEIGCECPLPLAPRPRPPAVASGSQALARDTATCVIADVYAGMPMVARGAVKKLRIVGLPVKTHPTMNYPELGLTHEDPGKFVLGTVPVEPDGSAYFRVPAGISVFFQALDERGMALRTMRSAVYFQPGQTASCIGCHESRQMAPPSKTIAALRKEPQPIQPGPVGSWPLDYNELVQPVLDRHCVRCHNPSGEGKIWDLSAGQSWETLVRYGKPSLADLVLEGYRRGRSLPGEGLAARAPLVSLLAKGHYQVALQAEDWERLIIWMDLYGQKRGYFDDRQYQELVNLREQLRGVLVGMADAAP